MAVKSPARRSDCPISYSLDVFGDRWTLLVVRDLVFRQRRYFRDFLASPEGIATNILADRLKTLECCGIVTRQADPEHAGKVIYTLTGKGVDLIPALLELVSWGAKYDPDTAAPKEFTKRIREDREGLIADLRASLKGKRK
jgi:DNA-binding HxlR family transcriptional regulator